MKHVKHMLVAVLTVFLAAVLAVPAFAAGSGSITVTPPTGTENDASNTYKLYKVFAADTDGSNYSYKLSGNHTDVPNGFILDDAGNVYLGTIVTTADETTFEAMVNKTKVIIKPTKELNDTIIAAIAGYVTDADLVDSGKTVKGMNPATWTGLDDGYYYVTTTTGSLVIIDSTKPAVNIADKNTVPGLDKKITDTDATDAGMAGTIDTDGKKALAEVGKEVEYTATITVGKGCKGYEFHDKMGSGLDFKGNEFVQVTIDDAEKLPSGSSSANFYTIKSKADDGDTLTITFVDGIAEGAKITIKYIGVVNSDALTIDTGKNTARVDYGDENGTNHTPDSETNVYNAKLTITKKDGKGQNLAGAGFVIKNANNKYYRYSENGEPATEAQGVEGEDGYVPAKAAVPKGVSWVDSIDDATENVSIADGSVPAFTGLVDGTYTLIEKTVPAGYNKAADSTFEIKKSDYTATNLAQTTTVINNQGSELPETGGMGTTILYTVGGIMVIAGIVMFLTKRRMASIEK